MVLPKISEGPWTKLFDGDFQDMPVEIYRNPESVLLVAIYEKEKGKVTGAVIELYKMFSAQGELSGFVETLPREVVVMTKHTKQETVRYLLLGSAPAYIKYEDEEFVKEVDSLLKKLKASSIMIKDVSKAYDLTLSEIEASSEHVKAAFFSQPLLIPATTTASHPAPSTPAHEFEGMAKGEVILGITKEKAKVVEPLDLFARSLVTEGESLDRMKAMHVLIESFLLSNTPVAILDREEKFSGLGEATPEREELQKYSVDAAPIGFPINTFRVMKDIVVDLNMINPEGMLELFGTGKNQASQLISEKMGEGNLESLEDLVKRVSGIAADDEKHAFQIGRAVRFLRIIGLRYTGLFGGENNIDEVCKTWVKAIGRAGIVEMKGLDSRQELMLAHSLVNGILEYYKKKGKTTVLKAAVAIPSAEKIVPLEGNILQREIAAMLSEIAAYGVGVILSAKNGTDLDRKLYATMETMINIVNGNDAGIRIKGRKGYRAFIRPGISRSPA